MGSSLRRRRETLPLVVRVSSRVDGRWRSPDGPAAEVDGRSRASVRGSWRLARPQLEAPERLRQPVERALDDLFALRNNDLEDELLDSPKGTRRAGLDPERRGAHVHRASSGGTR